jgi:hypothetical protein
MVSGDNAVVLVKAHIFCQNHRLSFHITELRKSRVAEAFALASLFW